MFVGVGVCVHLARTAATPKALAGGVNVNGVGCRGRQKGSVARGLGFVILWLGVE